MALINIGFFSEALGMCVDCNVFLPQSRADAPLGKRKVLYLLHGASGGNSDWIRYTNVERYAARHNLALVMPAAHMSSYTDMEHGGKFFTYIADELPAKMRHFFPLSEKREDNYIAGLSMGGVGALKIGLARPDKFSAIGCLSAGAYNTAPDVQSMWHLRYGERNLEGTEEDIYGNLRRIAAEGAPAPRIFHAIGTEDFLLPCARETRDVIASIPGDPFRYTYIEAPGAHKWEFWDEYIREFISWL